MDLRQRAKHLFSKVSSDPAPLRTGLSQDTTPGSEREHGNGLIASSIRSLPFPVEGLAVQYVIVLHSLSETLFDQIARMDGATLPPSAAIRRQEICAAVWAAIRAALDASTLSSDERLLVMQGLMERLLPHWQRFCAPEGLFAVWLADRSTNYLDT